MSSTGEWFVGGSTGGVHAPACNVVGSRRECAGGQTGYRAPQPYSSCNPLSSFSSCAMEHHVSAGAAGRLM